MMERHNIGRIHITTECNQNCLFCSLAKFPVKRLSFATVKYEIKKLKELGANTLFISGGEPTIHKDFFQILDFAKKTGFEEIIIQSNGSALDKNFLRKIRYYGNVRFSISFHSFEKNIFNRLSNSNHYELFLRNLKNIHDSNIPFFLAVVINKLNYKKLKAHIMFVRNNFPNMTHFSFNFIHPVGSAKKNKWIIPTLAETEKYIYETIKYMQEHGLTFRLERVPLCYMAGFEEFSTEVRIPVFSEKRITHYIRGGYLNTEKRSRYSKAEACNCCFLKELCPGSNPNYVATHGLGELTPVFIKPGFIIKRIIESRIRNNFVKNVAYQIKG